MYKTIIKDIMNAHVPYNGNSMMMALFFFSLMVIIFYCKNRTIQRSIIIPSIVLIAFLYVGVPIINSVTGLFADYMIGRLFWIIITPVIIAVGATLFIVGIKDIKVQCLAIVMLCAVIFYCGEFKISNAMFIKTENAYRLPQSTVDVTEHILSEMNSPKIIVPYTIAYPFRQISSDVHLLYGEDASYGRIVRTTDDLVKISDQMELTTPDLNYIVPMAREHDVNYILFDTTYTEFCENGNINIYGYPIDENYVADRSATVTFDELGDISVIEDERGLYWDLLSYGLEYDGTYGQYILYRINEL